MITELARNWWVLLIRGVLAVLFGILAFVWPGITLAVLVLLFGAYVLVDGIFALIGGFTIWNSAHLPCLAPAGDGGSADIGCVTRPATETIWAL